ncbi:hypothetical protein MC885_001550, partial [Smutsia gigantea]
ERRRSDRRGRSHPLPAKVALASSPTPGPRTDVTGPPEAWRRVLKSQTRCGWRVPAQIRPPGETMSHAPLGATYCARRLPLHERICRLNSP